MTNTEKKIECPVCHGTDIDGDDVGLDREWYHRSCTCIGCGCGFLMNYRIVSVDIEKEGKKIR